MRAAELSFSGPVVTLEKFGQVALPEGAVRDGEVIDGPTVTDAIRHLWTRTAFSSKKVIMGMANQRVVVREVELPTMSAADRKKALPYQVQDYLPMPVDMAVLDFLPLETFDNGTQRGLLVAASREAILANVQAATEAGLRVASFDLSSFALLRSMGTRNDPAVETEAVVDIGARVTNVVVHSGGVPRFVRILVMGGQDITDAVAERVGMAQLEAEGLKQQLGMQHVEGEWANASRALSEKAQSLIDEVRGSLDYYSSSNPGYPVQRIVISGGGSKLLGLAERLSISTRVGVVVGSPVAQMQIGNTGLNEQQLATVQPLAAVPVGLALGAA